MSKFEEQYQKIMKRTIQIPKTQHIIYEQKVYLSDLINESVFHIPFGLLQKIKEFVKTNNEKLILSKNDLEKVIDKDWEFYNELKKLDNEFQLIILHCNANKVQMLSGIDLVLQGYMCEFSENPIKKEFVWIDKSHDFSDNDHFLQLLKHELGHVWTFAFGSVNESFKIGQMKGRKFESLKINDLSKSQIDVLNAFYNGKFDLLKADFNYILSSIPGNEFAYEFTSICDEIIELLVNDYFECLKKNAISTNEYCHNLFSKLNETRFVDYSNLNIVKKYFSKKCIYDNFKNTQHIRNDIRRLFLIWYFGSNEQIEFLKNELEKEFKRFA